jgi:hypothetical protein
LEAASNSEESIGSAPKLFLKEKVSRQKVALELFHKKVMGDEFLRGLPVVRLPDIGTVQEPLNMETVNKFLLRSLNHG